MISYIETTYTVTGLTSSTDYTFTVNGEFDGDLSAASDKATITTGVLSAPNSRSNRCYIIINSFKLD
jgi:chitodextrinase